MNKPKFRVGPSRIGKNYGTRIHGNIKYNRRKQNMSAKREIKDSSKEKSVKVEQYYSFRDGCNCPQLYGLWELIKQIDDLALKCTEYAEDLINEERKNNPILMNAFEKFYEQWKGELERYPHLLLQLHSEGGHIKVQTFVEESGEKTPRRLEDGVRISTSPLHPRKNKIITEMSCTYCSARLPKIEYQNWFNVLL